MQEWFRKKLSLTLHLLISKEPKCGNVRLLCQGAGVGFRNNLHKGSIQLVFVFHSIIVKLKEHEEFFPVFHSFILELLQTLGKNKLYSQSTNQESVKLK